jgi:apolipoprotein N-acyltransferase
VKYFNSAFLFDAEGRVTGEYDKRHLVVFGEFIPFDHLIPWRLRAALGLPVSISEADEGAVFRAGKARVPLAPLVCFEDILPDLARADVRAGARMLVNVTNDAWFDGRWRRGSTCATRCCGGGEPRAAGAGGEHGGVVRDRALGAVAAHLSDGAGRTDGSGVLWADVAVPPDGMSLTFYTRFGDMYGIACAVATALWLATAGWKRRKAVA